MITSFVTNGALARSNLTIHADNISSITHQENNNTRLLPPLSSDPNLNVVVQDNPPAPSAVRAHSPNIATGTNSKRFELISDNGQSDNPLLTLVNYIFSGETSAESPTISTLVNSIRFSTDEIAFSAVVS
jgi:hypothetical protein